MADTIIEITVVVRTILATATKEVKRGQFSELNLPFVADRLLGKYLDKLLATEISSVDDRVNDVRDRYRMSAVTCKMYDRGDPFREPAVTILGLAK